MDNSPALFGPVAMITGRYPYTSMTFMDREVRALRDLGCEVATVSLRSVSKEQVQGQWQQEERLHVHPLTRDLSSPVANLKALFAALVRPSKTMQALHIAVKTCPGGRAGLLRHIGLFAASLHFAQHLRRIKAFHIHNHLGDSSGTVAMIASTLTGLPFSMTLHGPEIFDKAEYWHLSHKIEKASFVVCISNYAKSRTEQHAAQADLSKIQIVRCGIEPEQYVPLCPAPETNSLLFVGRLETRKGAKQLVKSLDILRRKSGFDIRLTIAGEGSQASALQADVDGMGLGAVVRFIGAVNEVAVADLLRSHDIVVVPSLSEGLPGVIMEAFASRRPVIASAVNGIPELVKDGQTGLLISPDDAEALAEAISTALECTDTSNKMALAGYRLVKRDYDARLNAQKLLSFIQGNEACSQHAQLTDPHRNEQNEKTGSAK